ncbi:hypothetical protein HOY80DRAFT_1076889 [Tuber brumale]|nr:hypothetical protein HOY80DRAFT_1076889 [Tuber brumale]
MMTSRKQQFGNISTKGILLGLRPVDPSSTTGAWESSSSCSSHSECEIHIGAMCSRVAQPSKFHGFQWPLPHIVGPKGLKVLAPDAGLKRKTAMPESPGARPSHQFCSRQIRCRYCKNRWYVSGECCHYRNLFNTPGLLFRFFASWKPRCAFGSAHPWKENTDPPEVNHVPTEIVGKCQRDGAVTVRRRRTVEVIAKLLFSRQHGSMRRNGRRAWTSVDESGFFW